VDGIYLAPLNAQDFESSECLDLPRRNELDGSLASLIQSGLFGIPWHDTTEMPLWTLCHVAMPLSLISVT
jgi:hypothetical protein